VTAEIMGVAEEEAREAYPKEAVHSVQSDSTTDLASNVERVVAW